MPIIRNSRLYLCYCRIWCGCWWSAVRCWAADEGSCSSSFPHLGRLLTYALENTAKYEGHSKINIRLVGKNKRVVIASKRTLSSNKELLFLLHAYPHTFSLRSVGVNTDKTWTLSSPLPPAVRYVL